MSEIVDEVSESEPKALSGDVADAIIMDAGSNAHVLPASDDGSAGPIEIGFPVNFFGKFHTTLFINTNGSITFEGPLYQYLPSRLKDVKFPVIAPFLADVDTRAKASGRVRYGTVLFGEHMAFCVNWIAVGYHQERTDKLNSFQLLLVDRNDTGLGNFDIVLNYNRLTWESGAATGGSGGLGGRAAAAGLSAGTGAPETFVEFPGTQINGALLDTHATTGLTRTRSNNTVLGRHVFRIRKGRLDIPWPAGRSLKLLPRLVKLRNGQVLALGDFVPIVDIFNPATNTWLPAKDSTENRRHHTATLLLDGQILVTGGEASPLTTELYDPVTGAWTASAPMNVGRLKHTATLLRDGRVLVAGGEDGFSNRHASAELYDPVTRSWTPTGSMSSARGAHTATLLSDGLVLVAAGELASSFPLSSAELYDPVTGTWKLTSGMASAHSGHTATLLQDGQVLVAGGSAAQNPDGLVEVYNPAAGTWKATAKMSRPRRRHAAVLLGTGHVLITGGFHEFSGILNEGELYDPALGSWSTAPSMQAGRESHETILLEDGRLLIVGGVSNTGQGTYEMYEPPLGL